MNHRHRRITQRARIFYQWFVAHPDEFISLKKLCDLHECSVGKLSQAAIQVVRRRVEQEGWMFPPAVPAGNAKYVLTRDPAKLLDPALHMGRIRSGVARRETVLVDYIDEHRTQLPPGDRAIASAMVAIREHEKDVQQANAKLHEKVTADLVAARKAERQSSNTNPT